MRRIGPVGFIATVHLLAACGEGSGPGALEITGRSPGVNAASVETGAPVRVTFSQALDPATLTPATFRVTLNDVARSAHLSYSAASRTAQAVAPLLPGQTYAVQVTNGVTSAGGAALDSSTTWQFTTRQWQPVTVDAAGDVGWWTDVAVDGTGRTHVTYQDRTNYDLEYATCAANCSDAMSWQTVTLDAGNSGYGTTLAVDDAGAAHVAVLNGTIEYFTCAAACETALNWESAVVDGAASLNFPSIGVDGAGGVHLAYYDGANTDLRYAECAAACTTAANWDAVTVDANGAVGTYASLAVAGDGRIHVGYRDDGNGHLKYATCASDCSTAANWDIATVDNSGSVTEVVSIAMDDGGGAHLAYTLTPSPFTVAYASCAADCGTAINWHTVDVASGFAPALAVDANGRLHLVYRSTATSTLWYATCATDCTTATNWESVVVDASLNVGTFKAIAVDPAGRLHVAYYDVLNQDLKYAE